MGYVPLSPQIRGKLPAAEGLAQGARGEEALPCTVEARLRASFQALEAALKQQALEGGEVRVIGGHHLALAPREASGEPVAADTWQISIDCYTDNNIKAHSSSTPKQQCRSLLTQLRKTKHR